MIDLKDLDRQFSYLYEIYDIERIESRANEAVRELELAVEECDAKLDEIERVLSNESIDVNGANFVEAINTYANDLPKNTRLAYHSLDSGFMKGGNRHIKVVDGKEVDFRKVADECFLVECNEGTIDYMPFDSNVKAIQENFENFTADKLIHGDEYFIYHPGTLIARLTKTKKNYDGYKARKGELLSAIDSVNELKGKYIKEEMK